MLSAVLAFAGISHAAPICNLVFSQCPKGLSGVINIPSDAIWLDSQIPVCSDTVTVQTGTNSAPPSIMFIIDNSGSMSNGAVDNHPNSTDPDEARFRVVREMLDTIAKLSPTAEVGLSIFSRRLQFDDRDNPFYKSAFPNDPTNHDAYIPLTQLNSQMAPGVKGVDSLKALLAYTGNGNLVHATTQPPSRANTSGQISDPIRDGTDITLGFDAAKEAMKTAKAAKGDQYFIFLSDGEPSSVDDSRKSRELDFQTQTDAPTTFTVFFRKESDQNPNPPATIVAMTASIKASNYSATNIQTAAFTSNVPGSQLAGLLQTKVLSPIFANTPAKATKAVVKANTDSLTNTAVDATKFTFAKRIPLSPNQTAVKLTYTYQFTDSGKTKFKDADYTFTLNRVAAGTPLGAGLATVCQEQGNIALFSAGTEVKTVTADHNSLDIHLTLTNGESCDGCKVEVKPNKTTDKENITLVPGAGYQTGNFGRETVNVPKPGDGKLQNMPTDSIIVTYVNPSNPLDVIRKAFPYVDISTVVTLLRHNDYARAGDMVPHTVGQQFVLVGPANLNPVSSDGKNWSIVPALNTRDDSLRYVGNVIEASRPFKVGIDIFTNLGQPVNHIEFTVTKDEFAKLVKGVKNGTRQLKVLWDNRTKEGNLAGTGAYILKTTVTLLAEPGISGEAISTDFRIVGVLRDQ